MNILHLNTHLDLGGITSHLETLGKALIKKGHRFSILSGGGLKIPALEQNGIRCFSLPIRTKSEIHPKLFAAIPRIARIIREEKFDILHAHTRVTQVLACALSCVTGVPFVSTAHGFYKARLGRKIFPCWGERVVAVSPLVAEELQKTHGIPLTKIRVVNNAVDIEDFEKRLRAHDGRKVRSENGIPDKSFVIGCISRLVRDKGQEYLVQALGLLTQKIPDSFLVLVGDGREKMRLETLVMKLGLNSRVKMISGVVDTTAILSSIDLFVHPATYREGFGLAIAECACLRGASARTRYFIPTHERRAIGATQHGIEINNQTGRICAEINPVSRGSDQGNSGNTATCQMIARPIVHGDG